MHKYSKLVAKSIFKERENLDHVRVRLINYLLSRQMDDSLEQPNVDLTKALVSESGEALEKDEEGQSSGDEDDGGLDWTKLSQVLP